MLLFYIFLANLAFANKREDLTLCSNNLDRVNRIAVRHPEPVGKWPYLVRLTWGESLGCGGTIISDGLILTAAHCCKSVEKSGSNMRIHFNDNDRKVVENDEFSFLLRRKDQDNLVKVHETYRKVSKRSLSRDDLCMITLPQRLGYDENNEICCTRGSPNCAEPHKYTKRFPCISHRKVPGNSSCWIAGWGTHIDKNAPSGISKGGSQMLIEADVTSISNSHCKKNLQNQRLAKRLRKEVT